MRASTTLSSCPVQFSNIRCIRVHLQVLTRAQFPQTTFPIRWQLKITRILTWSLLICMPWCLLPPTQGLTLPSTWISSKRCSISCQRRSEMFVRSRWVKITCCRRLWPSSWRSAPSQTWQLKTLPQFPTRCKNSSTLMPNSIASTSKRSPTWRRSPFPQMKACRSPLEKVITPISTTEVCLQSPAKSHSTIGWAPGRKRNTSLPFWMSSMGRNTRSEISRSLLFWRMPVSRSQTFPQPVVTFGRRMLKKNLKWGLKTTLQSWRNCSLRRASKSWLERCRETHLIQIEEKPNRFQGK